MSWFFKGRKTQKHQGSSMGLETGSHRSPGLAAICHEMRERGEVSLLDLGASSTENVQFFSGFTSNVTVVGLFQACSGQGANSQRSNAFRFDENAIEALPKGKEQFDIVIAWDLLHYFDSQELVEFNRGLRRLCRPEALIYLLASNNAPIAKQPLHFRIEGEDSLFYTLPDGGASGASKLVTRDVEQRMEGFKPLRLFQLRNGFQEFIFRFRGGAESAGEADQMSSEVLENRAEKGAVVAAPAKSESPPSSAAEPVDGVAGGSAARDSDARDSDARDSAARDSNARDSAARDGDARDGDARDGAAGDSDARDTGNQGARKSAEPTDDSAPVPSRGRPPVQRGRRKKRGRH